MQLADYIGEIVTADFGGRPIEGVVRDIDYGLSPIQAPPELRIATDGATIRVSPEDLID
jgi:hypothetical protein